MPNDMFALEENIEVPKSRAEKIRDKLLSMTPNKHSFVAPQNLVQDVRNEAKKLHDSGQLKGDVLARKLPGEPLQSRIWLISEDKSSEYAGEDDTEETTTT